MDDVVAGAVVEISPLVRRITAPNPGMMTGPGTNTYLVGRREVTVIDPGPDIAEHLDAVEAAAAGAIRWIAVTHTHSDHSPGAAALHERTGAERRGFVSRDGFVADVAIAGGERLPTDEYSLRAVHTPGHASNHLCYVLDDERMLFSGDHIMGGSTVVIAPPDGDMGAYLRSLDDLDSLGLRAIAPGHGSVIQDPAAKIDEYRRHRLGREAQVMSALQGAGETTAAALVQAIYTDVPEALHRMARLSVWAHLRKLAADGEAHSDDVDDIESTWRATTATRGER